MLAYLKRLGITTDEWLSVLTGGSLHETISLRVARAKAKGSLPACWVCAYLSRFVEKNHCARQLAGIALSPQGALLAGLQLGVIMTVIWWLFLHTPQWVLALGALIVR